MPKVSTFTVVPGAMLPVISAICAAVSAEVIDTVPVMVTVVEPEIEAMSCWADMPVALTAASPAGVFETSAAIALALRLAVIETFSTVVTEAMLAATAPS